MLYLAIGVNKLYPMVTPALALCDTQEALIRATGEWNKEDMKITVVKIDSKEEVFNTVRLLAV